MDKKNYNRDKIYEKIDYTSPPIGYHEKIPWTIQQQIAATNGRQYIDRIGKLKDYPHYELPVKNVTKGLMLDIGNGWGRWLAAGYDKGYIPIGIDIRLEFCKTALNTLKAQGKSGYSIVADLKELPFKDNIFDLVWSFSVIQHTHKYRLISCLKHIKRILSGTGFTKLEFPNKYGFRNFFGPVKTTKDEAKDYNSWVVRYYTLNEYRQIFMEIFNNFKYSLHSALGIGVLKEDLKYVSFKNKILCAASLALSQLIKFITPLTKFADSIYIDAFKTEPMKDLKSIEKFLAAHNNKCDNLNVVHLLQCPISSLPLGLSNDRKFLVTSDGMIKYPVKDNIPILIKSEAIINNS